MYLVLIPLSHDPFMSIFWSS